MTSYDLVFRFPEVANHVNLTICLNVAMILAMAYSFVRHRNADTAPVDYFTAISPLLRLSLVLVYFLAGFHKLNSDYFNPEASCAADVLGLVIAALRTSVLGIPAVVMVTAVGVFAGYRLSRRGRFGSRGSRVFTTVVVTIGSVGLGGALAILFEPQTGRAPALAIGTLAAAAVLGWELAGSLLLTVPRLQAAILAFSIDTMHAALALVGFADFGALALALLFTFVPPSYQQALICSMGVRILWVRRPPSRHLRRDRYRRDAGLGDARHCPATAACAAHPAARWPCSRHPADCDIFSPSPGRSGRCEDPRPAYARVPVRVSGGAGAHRHYPDLGLRTAGNFSMFSNLRTEGDTSNHLLLGGNPLKVWGYQEDIVWIVDIDDRAGQRITITTNPRADMRHPSSSFANGSKREPGRRSRTPDHGIAANCIRPMTSDGPRWRTDSRTRPWSCWIRIIQPGQPNWCRGKSLPDRHAASRHYQMLTLTNVINEGWTHLALDQRRSECPNSPAPPVNRCTPVAPPRSAGHCGTTTPSTRQRGDWRGPVRIVEETQP